jgi:predicted ThiF/HesA family dinucleotide-utilizing enzyme
MAEALLISRKDIVKFTAMNGNVDTDKFIQYIKIAQDTHIQNYLGTDLLKKIQADIIAGSLAGNYLTLLTTYVKPMLIHYAMVEYLHFASFTISNKGVYKHSAENSETASTEEIDKLVASEQRIAEHYTQRFVDYICNNSNLYPEYNSNSGEDMYPSTDVNYTNWYI